MASLAKKRDLIQGPIFMPMIAFVIPIMLTGIIQIFYNMADNIVVGQFSGDPDAIAAIGSTLSLTNMIVNTLMGLASGAGVVVAQSFGARDDARVSRAVHTTVAISVIGGIAIGLLGIGISSPVLHLMGTKEAVFDKAVMYMRIICAGIPASAVYNFSATVLRSVGDSRTPLFILSSAGLVNVLLNLVFVIVFRMSIAGVATATIISQYVSAAVILIVLIRSKGKSYRFEIKKLKIEKDILLQILRFGIPAGIQSALFGVSNVIITSATNSFSTAVVSAKTISGNIEGLLYTALNSYFHASITFVGQNYGAGKPDRIRKSIFASTIQVAVLGIVLGNLMIIFGRELTMLYIDTSDPNLEEVVGTSMELLKIMLSTYVLCGFMESFAGALRGLGYSIVPTVVNLFGTCGARIVWVSLFFTVFPIEARTIDTLFLIYPISWTVTSLTHATVLFFAVRKLSRKEKKSTSESGEPVTETKT